MEYNDEQGCMSGTSANSSLEGEILQRRYAIVEVIQAHGDWYRCRVFDMQELGQRDAVVQIIEGEEPEIQLLPVESPPEPPAEVPPPPPAVSPEPPPVAVTVTEQPAPAVAEEPESKEATTETGAESTPPTEADGPPPRPDEKKGKRQAKPGRLEAAWFSLGARMEEATEEDQEDEEEAEDLIITPSKVHQVADELTTKTYMRYRLDATDPKSESPPSSRQSGWSVALPVARNRRLVLLLAAAVGVIALVLVLVLLVAR